MNKNDLVKKVAAQVSGATQKDISVVTDLLFETIVTETAKGQKIHIANFGTFEVTERAAREGKNPRTQEPITIPASRLPKFKPAKQFKDSVNR